MLRWKSLAIIGIMLLVFGMFFLVYGTGLPVYYAGGGAGISKTGRVVGGLAPDRCEILILTLPDTIHIRVRSIEPVIVRIDAPNGTTLAQWQNETVNEDYPVPECGSWQVYISQSSGYFVYGEVLTTAPAYAHPALMYAMIPLLLGSLSVVYSVSKRRQAKYFESVLFQQNIGGRWVFLQWAFILAFISQAPVLIPSYPWLYLVLVFITVFGVFSSIALAYVKIYLSTGGLLIEAPFLNFFRLYEINKIYGYTVTKEEKQRWFFLRPLPSFRAKKEEHVTIFIIDRLPTWFWVLSLGKRFRADRIILRPKSTQNFATIAEKLNIVKKETATI
ncbi:MAG: hypothetical protein ABSF24_08850 [Candidatus Bathyarchaeia archaeon]